MKEMFEIWWGRHWRMVLIGLLAAALIVSLSVIIPKLEKERSELATAEGKLVICQQEKSRLEAEVANVTQQLVICQQEKSRLEVEVANVTQQLVICQQEKSRIEEDLAEALGESLPTKAEVEALLREKFSTCRTITVEALRETFPDLKIEGLPLTPQGEEGSCYVLIRAAENRGFFIIGQTLIPLIVW